MEIGVTIPYFCAFYVKNTCFSLTMHIYVQIFEYLCGKMLDWGFCFLKVKGN